MQLQQEPLKQQLTQRLVKDQEEMLKKHQQQHNEIIRQQQQQWHQLQQQKQTPYNLHTSSGNTRLSRTMHHITNESKEVSPFPADQLTESIHESITKQDRDSINNIKNRPDSDEILWHLLASHLDPHCL